MAGRSPGAWGVVALSLALGVGARAGTAAEREALRTALKEIVEHTVLARGRVGALVASLDDGKAVFAVDADELLNPASNVKLFTAAAALARLGLDYRFETEFLAKAPPGRSGEVAGPLYVRGKGDPTLVNERLWGIAAELYHTGVRGIAGDIVIDDSHFDADRLAPGYDQDHTDRAYLAPTGAASVNWNAVAIYVAPGPAAGTRARVEVEPPCDYFAIESRAGTVSRRSRQRLFVSSVPAGEKQRIMVAGRIPVHREGTVTWKKVDNPPAYLGYALKAVLERRGIPVRGKVKLGVVPADARRLYVAESETLDLILKRLNKTSSNFIGEQLVKTLGAHQLGAPGSFAKGIAVIEDFLDTEVGIPRGSYVMKNGSGLNDTNRISAAQLVRLLEYMHRRYALAPEYLSSLGIAGRDGTVRWRMDGTDAAGRLRAKTGTLENVASLSGYVQSVGGERFAFAIVANDFPARPSQVVSAIDAMGAAIAAAGSKAGPAAASQAALGPPSEPASDAELKARIPTYANLGRMGDKRNVPFLRTALRTERDPALRAVVAEALYLSHRDDGAGARALLDNFQATPEVFGRLKAAAREISTATPAAGAVADLAAEGNPEALGRLVEAAPLCGDDETARIELAEAFAEIGRTAPEELIAVLRKANEANAGAALDLIAKGLVRDADPDHPLPKAIRQAQGSVDEDLAAYARMLDAGLSTRIALEKVPPKAAEPARAAGKDAAPASEARPGGG